MAILSFFLKSRYFHLSGRRKMNIGTFSETYVDFLINVVLQLFSKYYQSYINSKVKVAKNSTVRKNAQAGLGSKIKLSLIELRKSFVVWV